MLLYNRLLPAVFISLQLSVAARDPSPESLFPHLLPKSFSRLLHSDRSFHPHIPSSASFRHPTPFPPPFVCTLLWHWADNHLHLIETLQAPALPGRLSDKQRGQLYDGF